MQSIQYRILPLSSDWSEWQATGGEVGGVDLCRGLTCFEICYSGIGSISYRGRVEGKGWTVPSHNGEMCGDCVGKDRITALSISLNEAPGYHVFYRVRGNSGAFSEWKRDGAMAGYEDGDSFIVAFEIQLVMDDPHILYRTYVQEHGWTNFVSDNQISGMDGKGFCVEAIYVHYKGPGRLTMQACVERKGWLSEVPNGVVCGTERQGLRMESFRMNLYDLDGYHVYYCVCIKGMGWQSWVRDGEDAGMEGSGQIIEAIRIRIAM